MTASISEQIQKKRVLVIGSGIAGMACAVRLAEAGIAVELVSPFPSERAQSVMAAGGINAVLSDGEEGDSVASHIDDTLRGGSDLAGPDAVRGLCTHAEEIVRYLENIGTVFTVGEDGRPARRAFGGQSHKRTCYCGSATGKQIVSALVMEARRFEAAGLIRRRLWSCFHSALIRDGICHGVILFDESTGGLEDVYADAVVVATGGQNALFGKTTGSTQCDGYTAGRLFMQGVDLKNLEFIQYHPTTLETSQKKMLVSEAVRGESGRLFYVDDGRRVYFLEDKYGPNGNLLTRDIISREIDKCGKDVFLGISHLPADEIDRKLPEVRDLCQKYGGIDIRKEPIPVTPSVHFFMGGLAVRNDHETNIRNLFAIGECASIYHGANRLGGNSLLAAMHGAFVAAESIEKRPGVERADGGDDTLRQHFAAQLAMARAELQGAKSTDSPFPVMYIRDMLAETMRKYLGIARNEKQLQQGIAEVDYYLSIADKIAFDSSGMIYEIYSLKGNLVLARAVLCCALWRKESRGAHWRDDFPETRDDYGYATVISYEDGQYRVHLDQERAYER